MKCAVINCKNRVRFTFPKDKKVRDKWLHAIRRPDFVPRDRHGICMDHFSPEHILTESREGGFKLVRARLTKDAIPCIFPWNNLDLLTNENTVIKSSSNNFERIHQEEENVNEAYSYGNSFNIVDIQNDIQHYEEIITCNDITCDDSNENSNREYKTSDNNIKYTADNACTLNKLVHENIVRNIFKEHHYHISSVSDSQNNQPNALCRYSIEQFKDDPKGMLYFTGLESYEKFMTVFNTLGRKVYELNYQYEQCLQREISAENKLFLTLWKLRRNCPDYELSRHFCVSEIAVKVIFKKMVIFMVNQWSILDIWPTKEFINSYMPEGCKSYYSSKKTSSNNRKENILSNLRIYIEKNIKNYKILSQKLNPSYITLAPEITGVCIMLCNFKEIIKK